MTNDDRPQPCSRRRRVATLGALLFAFSSGVRGAPPAPPHIAFLSTASEKVVGASSSFFKAMMLTVAMVEGRDYLLDFYLADGHVERFPALAQAAVARKPALIFVTTLPAARAAQQATGTIPIVLGWLNDPVGLGLVASLARPGGNITGMAGMADEFIGKLVELLRELAPGARRIAVFVNPQNPSNAPVFEKFQEVARAAGMSAQAADSSGPQQVEAALAELARTRPDVLVTGIDNSHYNYRPKFAAFASAQRVPIVSAYPDEETALVTYTANRSLPTMAAYIQKLLAGARPADLPVQQPTSFELVVNLRIAQALNVKVPQTLLLRATKLIE